MEKGIGCVSEKVNVQMSEKTVNGSVATEQRAVLLRCLHTKKEQEQNTLISITHIVHSLETGFIPVLFIFRSSTK